MSVEQGIPAGYKRTEVGVIPRDWNVVPLRELIQHTEYGSSAPSKRAGRVPVLRMGNIQAGKIDWTDLVYTDDPREMDRFAVHCGDVLFNRTNTVDLVGKTAIFDGTRSAVFAGYLIRIAAKPERLDPRYLNYVMNTPVARAHSLKVLSVAVGQANINAAKLQSYPIPLPSRLAEQRAIADALGDVDALLDALGRQITKHRDLKRAAMQQLLTGRTRLPGFTGEWPVMAAGAIGRFVGGCGFPQQFQGKSRGQYPYFKVSDMNHPGNEVFMLRANNYVRDTTRQRLGANIVPSNSIVFAKVGAAVYMERKRITARPSCIDNNMAAFVLESDQADVRFVHFLLLQTKLASLANTTALPAINGRSFEALALGLPPVPEQTAIGAVLSDMDAATAALEARRVKTRDLKQAMLQELLTGRTRLV